MIMAMLMVYEDFSVIWEKHFLISADKLIDLWGYFMTTPVLILQVTEQYPDINRIEQHLKIINY